MNQANRTVLRLRMPQAKNTSICQCDKRSLVDNKKKWYIERKCVSVASETFSLIKCVDMQRPRRHRKISAAVCSANHRSLHFALLIM